MLHVEEEKSNSLGRDSLPTDLEVTQKVLFLQAQILGLTLGVIGGLGIFLATAWLVIKGGEDVGAHLSLLENYFPGYSVSFFGSILGAFYGAAVGYVFGLVVAYVYNCVASLRKKQG